jgi:hypothetical protein
VPSSNGVSAGPMMTAFLGLNETRPLFDKGEILYQVITLSATGEAETPAGGSVCIRLKSRIKRRRAVVDMVRAV